MLRFLPKALWMSIKIQEIITYKPATSDNKGVISESNTQTEQQLNGTSSAGGTAGTQTNADVTNYPGITVNGNVIYTKDEQSYKYLVSQVKEQIQGDAASVQDMTISVVINKAMMDEAQKPKSPVWLPMLRQLIRLRLLFIVPLCRTGGCSC